MRVVYTEDALRDLDAILSFIVEHYPTIVASFESRLRAAVTRIGSVAGKRASERRHA